MTKECDEKGREEEKEPRQKLQDLLQKKASQAAESETQAAQQPSPAGSSAAAQPAVSGAATPARDETSGDNLEVEIEKIRRELEKHYKDHCKEEPRTRIQINCGLALDCQGNELVLRKPLLVDLLSALSPQEVQQVKHGAWNLYVSVCYCERGVDPVRPVLPEACGAVMDCSFGKIQESGRVHVTLEPPVPDLRSNTFCEPSNNPYSLLARIDCFVPGHGLEPHQIHNELQRPVSLYDPTAIAGISWRHGHTYTQEEAKDLLGTEHEEGPHHRGLEIRFTRAW